MFRCLHWLALAALAGVVSLLPLAVSADVASARRLHVLETPGDMAVVFADAQNAVSYDSMAELLYFPGADLYFSLSDRSFYHSSMMPYSFTSTTGGAIGLGMGMDGPELPYDGDGEFYYDPNYGFEYDPSTGYFHDSVSDLDLLYDVETGLFYDPVAALHYDPRIAAHLSWDAAERKFYDADAGLYYDADLGLYYDSSTGLLYDPVKELLLDRFTGHGWSALSMVPEYDEGMGMYYLQSDGRWYDYDATTGLYVCELDSMLQEYLYYDAATGLYFSLDGMSGFYRVTDSSDYYDPVSGYYYDDYSSVFYRYDSAAGMFVDAAYGNPYVPYWMEQSGFLPLPVAVDTSGMYYDSTLEMYYDSAAGMYYDSLLGLYLNGWTYHSVRIGADYYYDSMAEAYVDTATSATYTPFEFVNLTASQITNVTEALTALDLLASCQETLQQNSGTHVVQLGDYYVAPLGAADAVWFDGMLGDSMGWAGRRVRMRAGLTSFSVELLAEDMSGVFVSTGLSFLVSEDVWRNAVRAVELTLVPSWTGITGVPVHESNQSGMGSQYVDTDEDLAAYALYSYDPHYAELFSYAVYRGAWEYDQYGLRGENVSPSGVPAAFCDIDGDGLSDMDECLVHGTSPWSFDTDGDGMGDGLELLIGSNPLVANADTDGDGMPDVWEMFFGLNPGNPLDAYADPDRDGVPNLLECQLGTSPVCADTDGDGLRDGDEVRRGTDPCRLDTDGDGVPDRFEVQAGLDPLAAEQQQGGSSVNPAQLAETVAVNGHTYVYWTLLGSPVGIWRAGPSDVVWERTFTINRRSAWQQFFVSASPTAAAEWSVEGGTLEWVDSGGASGSASASSMDDSLRIQLSADASTVTMRLRASGWNKVATSAPLYLLTYVPDLTLVGAKPVQTPGGTMLDVFTQGLEEGITVTVSRVWRPCSDALSQEEADVGALLLADLSGSLPENAPSIYEGGPSSGKLHLPGAGLYPKPGGSVWLPPFAQTPVEHMLVLDPAVRCDPPEYGGPGRLSYDFAAGAHKIVQDYPLDTECLRRGWASNANGDPGSVVSHEVVAGVDTGSEEYSFVACTHSNSGRICNGAVSVHGIQVWTNSVTNHAAVGEYDFTDPLSDECGCSSGCADGSCDALEVPEAAPLRFRIPLGSPRKGRIWGFVYFIEEDGLPVSPSSFKVLAHDDSQFTETVTGTTRTFACAATRGREIVAEQMSNGVCLTVKTNTQILEHTWVITNGDESEPGVHFRKISRAGNTMFYVVFSRDASTGEWKRKDKISNTSEKVGVAGGLDDAQSGNTLTETRTVRDAQNRALVRHVTEKKRIGSFSKAVLRETRKAEQRWNESAQAWITVSERIAEYWDNAATKKFGKVRLVKGSGTAWEYHDYDSDGRETLRVEQRNGSVVPGNGSFPGVAGGVLSNYGGLSDAFVTVYGYALLAGDSNSDDDVDRPRQEDRYVVEYGTATLVGRTWRRYTHLAVGGVPAVKCETWRACSQSAAWNDPGNAYSYETVFDEYAPGVPAVARGEIAESLDEDGVLATRTLSVANGVASFTERKRGPASLSQSSPQQSTPFPTYTVTDIDATRGTTLREATYVDAGGEGVSGLQADVLVEEEVNTYDEQDRLRRTDYLDGTSATNHYSCCRLLWRRDREGRRVLRSAVTGEDHLYYAEEDAWIREIANGGHKTTQHFMDALGRETNTVVYVAQSEGEAVDWTASNQARAAGSAAVTTTVYPHGTDDLAVRVDERGKTTTNETSYAQDFVTTVETVTTNDVFVLKTITVSTRGGGSTTRREWTAAGGVPAGGPSSPTAAWTQTSRGTSYDQYGCRVETVTEFSHDAPYGTVTSTSTYDFLGRLVASSRPGMNNSSIVTTTTYDGATSRRLSSTTTGSPQITFSYNSLGEVEAITRDGISRSTATTYEIDDGWLFKVDTSERQVSGSLPVLTGETRELLWHGSRDRYKLRITTGEDGRTTTRMQSVSQAFAIPDIVVDSVYTQDGTYAETFSHMGLALWEDSSEGSASLTYDSMGRLVYESREDPLDKDSYRSMAYDISGNMVWDFTQPSQLSQAGSVLTLSVYDAFGRETKRTTELSNPSTNIVVATSYDPLGRPILSSGDQYPVRKSYDGAGRQTVLGTTRDGGLNWDDTSWTYDPATGLRTAKTYADDSQVLYSYTDDGKPVRTTWARGAWKENSYDSQRGLLSGTTYSASSTPAVACTRNAAGLLSAVQIGNAYACGYTYDEHLKCTEEALTNDYQSTSQYTFTLTRSYDSSLRPSTTAVSHGVCTFAQNQRSYDYEGRLCGHVLTSGTQLSIGGPETLAVAVTHAGGHLTAYAYTFPNGSTLSLAIAREPGRIGWVTGRTYTMGVTTVYGWQVSHDALGRPVSTADSESAARTWTYNERSEMTGCTSSDGSYSYFYDSIGNRTSSSITSGNLSPVTHSYTANGLNQYDYVDLTALAYDADGNLTNDGQYSYAYDCENRLVSVTPVSPSAGDLSIVNEYDHMNRRVRKTVRRYDGMGWSDQERHSFVWDGWNIVLERIDVGGSTTRIIEYYWGEDFSGTEQGAGGVGGLLAVSCDGEFYVPIYGGNGNIMGYVDASGAFAAKFVYDPYGNVVLLEGDLPLPLKDGPPVDISGLHGSDFSFGFSTKYHDREVGLIAYQLRSYSPTLGRWLNRDPIEEEGGVNLYGFVDNGPVFTADSIGSAKFKGKSKTSGFFYSFSVDKCEVVIIYGHGHIRLPHEVTFVDKKTSAAYFWGCWPDVTNSKIPRENRLEESVGPHKEYYDDQVFDRLKTLRPIALLRAKKICESGCCKGGVWVRFLFSPSDSWETSILDSAKGYSSYNKRKKLFGGGVWEGDTHVQCDK